MGVKTVAPQGSGEQFVPSEKPEATAYKRLEPGWGWCHAQGCSPTFLCRRSGRLNTACRRQSRWGRKRLEQLVDQLLIVGQHVTKCKQPLGIIQVEHGLAEAVLQGLTQTEDTRGLALGQQGPTKGLDVSGRTSLIQKLKYLEELPLLAQLAQGLHDCDFSGYLGHLSWDAAKGQTTVHPLMGRCKVC